MRALLACDGGGTKTEFILFSPDGHVVDRIVLGATNPNVTGMETACVRLIDGAKALSRTSAPIAFFAGIAGSASGENGKKIAAAVTAALPGLPFTIDSDIRNVIYSADAGERCLAAITGTGSIVYARDGEKLERYGGWGYLFDRAGSGFDLGRDAITHALACDDGLAPRTALTELVESRLNGTAKECLDRLYAEGRSFIASFAPLVFEALSHGDAEAEAILAQNAGRISALIAHAYESTGFADVILAGGLTKHPEWVAAISGGLPQGLTIILPDLPPIYGAARRALELAGIREGPDFRRKFTRDLRTDDQYTGTSPQGEHLMGRAPFVSTDA